MTTDAYAKADAMRVEAYGAMRLLNACRTEEARQATMNTWALRYMVATHMMMLAQPRHDAEVDA